MLSISWNWKGITFFKLLPNNQTINFDVYCRQLDKLNAAIKPKRTKFVSRKDVIYHHENARPHTSLVTLQKLLQLGWDVLPNPPYSPDLASLDYYLFWCLQNFLTVWISVQLKALKSTCLRFHSGNGLVIWAWQPKKVTKSQVKSWYVQFCHRDCKGISRCIGMVEDNFWAPILVVSFAVLHLNWSKVLYNMLLSLFNPFVNIQYRWYNGLSLFGTFSSLRSHCFVCYFDLDV